MKDTDIAWAAGIIDGEGCLSIARKERLRTAKSTIARVTHSPNIRVSMSHHPTLFKLQTLFGGNLRRDKLPLKAHWKQMWSWEISGNQAREFNRLILPYLVTKKEESEVLEKYFNLEKVKFPKGGCSLELISSRDYLRDEITRLKRAT